MSEFKVGGWDFSPENLMTPSEVAKTFKVDPKTVTRWEQAGKLTSIRTLGGLRRYSRQQIMALLRGGMR